MGLAAQTPGFSGQARWRLQVIINWVDPLAGTGGGGHALPPASWEQAGGAQDGVE